MSIAKMPGSGVEFIRRHPVAALVAFVALVLSIGAMGMEITRINIRFAMMTQEMARYPLGCFPTINGLPYADYPMPYNLFSYWTSLGARFVNHFTLSLPTIIFACYTLAMTAAIGDRIRPGMGLAAALFSLLSVESLNIFIQFSIDMPVAAAAVTIVYFLLKYDCSYLALPAYMLSLAAAFAIRGPLGIILAGAIAAGFIVGMRRWKALAIFGVVGAAVAAACLALAVWAIKLQGGNELLREVVDWQVSSRIEGGKIFYYFTNAMVSFALTTFIALIAVLMKRRELTVYPLASLLLWMLLPMVLLSIPGCKHLRYLSPALPGFALTAAYGYTADDDSRWAKFPDLGIFWLDRLFCPLMAAGLCGFAVYMLFTPFPALAGYCAGGAAAIVLIHLALRGRSDRLAPVLRLALMGLVCTAMLHPPIDALTENSDRFVTAAEARRQGGLYFFRLGPDHDDLKYLFHLPQEKRRQAIYLMPAEKCRNSDASLMNRMYPIQAAEALLPKLAGGDMIITTKKHYKQFVEIAEKCGRQIRIVVKGRLGHRDAFAMELAENGGGH